MNVGVRELRDNLSRYLERVRAGAEIVVTDRGRAVARVVPIEDGQRQPSALDRLIADGLASGPTSMRRLLPERRTAAKLPVSPLVAEQRR